MGELRSTAGGGAGGAAGSSAEGALVAALARIGFGGAAAVGAALAGQLAGHPAPAARKGLFLQHMLTPCGPAGKACILGEVATGAVSLGDILTAFPFEQFAPKKPPPPALAQPSAARAKPPAALPAPPPAARATPSAAVTKPPPSPGDPRLSTHPREVIGQMFFNSLVGAAGRLQRDNLGASRLEELARELELSVYNYVIRNAQLRGGNVLRSWDNPTFVSYYSARAATVQLYLDPGSSMVEQYGLRLAQDLFNGAIPPAQVGGMTEEELCPEGFSHEVSTVAHRKKQKVEKRITALWRCPNCKSRASTARSVQDRSLDEPASVYCTCTVCGIDFKGA